MAAPAHETVEPEAKAEQGHSGRLLVRMPRSLHSELARAARQEGVSLNAFINSILVAAVGRRQEAEAPPDAPADPPSRPAPPEQPPAPARGVRLALAANFVLVAIVAAVAIALLVIALREGF